MRKICFIAIKYAIEVSPVIKGLLSYFLDKDHSVELFTDRLYLNTDFKIPGLAITTIEEKINSLNTYLENFDYLISIDYPALSFLFEKNINLNNVVYFSLESIQYFQNLDRKKTAGILNQCCFGIIQSNERKNDFINFFENDLKLGFELFPVSLRPLKFRTSDYQNRILYSGYLADWSGLVEFIELFEKLTLKYNLELYIQGHSRGTELYLQELNNRINYNTKVTIDTNHYNDEEYINIIKNHNIGLAVYKSPEQNPNWDNLLFSSGKIANYLWNGYTIITNICHDITSRPPFIFIKSLNDFDGLSEGIKDYFLRPEYYQNEALKLADNFYNLDKYAPSILLRMKKMKNLSSGKPFKFADKIYIQDNKTIGIFDNNSDFNTNGELDFVAKIIQDGCLIFDVGANKGEWAKKIIQINNNVNIVSFEPVPAIYQTLINNLEGMNIRCENLALSSEEGSADFFYYNDNEKRFSTLSTFYRRTDAEKQLNTAPSKILVTKTTLDNYCINNNFETIDFCKIDTEGSENDVLLGAAYLLNNKKIKILQFEYGGTYLDAKITLKQICRFLTNKHYLIFKIIPGGLIHISKWEDTLESYQYANYCAVLCELLSGYSLVEFPEDKFPFSLKMKQGKIKLHLGCGQQYFDEYINIDFPSEKHTAQTKSVADFHYDITKLYFPDNSVDEIRLHHVFEHFDRAVALALLVNWYNWLKPGGHLIIETPDLEACFNILNSKEYEYKEKQIVLRHLFGSHEADWAVHYDGWYKEKFTFTLSMLGFTIKEVIQNNWKMLFNIIVVAQKEKQLNGEEINLAVTRLLQDSMVDDSESELRKLKIWYNKYIQTLESSSANKKAEENVFIIVSKDRPLQLHACLKSLIRNYSGIIRNTIKILYKASNKNYMNSYVCLQHEFTDILFKEELDFKSDLLNLINGYKYITFVVDDTVFTDNFDLEKILKLLEQQSDVLGFSLRLGENIRFHYPSNSVQPEPDNEEIGGNVVKTDWTKSQKYFAYPLEVSSSVYRLNDLMNLLQNAAYKNPNTLEEILAANRNIFFNDKNKLLFYKKSVAFSIPLNLVQAEIQNRNSEKQEFSAEKLLEIYNNGSRIDVEKLQGYKNNSCHQEIDLPFINEDIQKQEMVSIYMAVFNGEKYIEESINSIINQTYKNLELIIVDDGSEDNTWSIIEIFIKKDSRIRGFKIPKSGVVEARNYALSKISEASEYVMNHDSDDISYPNKVEKLINYLKYNPKTDIVGTFAEYFDDEGNQLGYPSIENDPEKIFISFGEVNSVIHSAALMKKSVILNLNGYDKNFPAAQDYDLFARALINGYKIANIPEVLHRIRLHKQSIGSRLSDLQKEMAQKVQEKYRSFLNNYYKSITKKLKLLLTVEFYYPHIGGAEIVVQKIAEGMVKMGHSVTVATSKDPSRNFKELNGVVIEEFDVYGKYSTGLYGTDIARYQDFLKDSEFDIIFNYAAQQWATDLAFPVVEYNKNKIKHVLAPCGYSALKDYHILRWIEFKDYFEKILPTVIPLYDKVIYHSTNYKDYEYGKANGFKNEFVIPNGVDLQEFNYEGANDFRIKYNIHTKFMLLCVANFIEGKGHLNLLHLFENLQRDDVTLVLIGKEGNEYDKIKNASDSMNNTVILKNILRIDTIKAFFSADIFIFASEIEAAPLVIYEAMAASLPFISTDVGNVKELTGGVVSNISNFIFVINDFLNNEEKRKRIGEIGRSEILGKYNWEIIVKNYEQVFMSIVSK